MSPRTRGGLYELVVAVGLAAMLLYAVGSSAVPDILAVAERRGYSAAWVSVSSLCFVLSLWTRGWYFAGPLAVSAGTLQWMGWQRPMAWLRREMVSVLVVGGALAAVVAVLAGLALAATGSSYILPAFVIWAVLGLLVVATIHLQRRDLDGVAQLVPVVLGLAGVILAAGEAWNGLVAVVIGSCLMAALGFNLPRGLASSGVRAELTPRWQLQRGARNRWSVGAGVTLMDGEIVRIVRQRNAKVTKRLLPPFVYNLPWPVNLSVAVLVRGLRTIATAVAFALPLTLAVHVILGPVPAVVVVVLLEFFVTVSISRSAQTWLVSNALPRIWVAGGIRVPLALAAPSLVVCLAITVTGSFALSLPLLVVLILAALPGAIILRRRRAHADERGLTVASTPMGAVSVQAVDKVIAGPDVVLGTILLVNWLI